MKTDTRYSAATPLALALVLFQGAGIPWWVWVAIILVILILLMIGLVRQQEPGPPLPPGGVKPSPPDSRATSPATEEQAPGDESREEPVTAPEPPQELPEPEEETTAVSAEEAAAAEEAEEAAGPVEEQPADDLRRIEGVGPKVAGLLQEADIRTFGDLAQAEEAQLREILDEASLRMINPSTWPEQAKLAAEGAWDKLEALQEDLKGGRR
ncbi:MAG: hypothetical protein R3300_17350 [Candidatus Promineifilaceae bacterium]|nr:hypothetical protein [Candidatus Promineifilaceae bacterium]